MYLPSNRPRLRKHQRVLVLLVVFVVVFLAARQFLPVINILDYQTWTNGLRKTWVGETPYNYAGFFLPPWAIPYLMPIANQPIEIWLALTVALFVTMILDLGKPSGLLLLLHPAFVTLHAAANGEWLLVGPGLWLLYRFGKGWGRGLAWLLLACKPQSTILLLAFDGIDALRNRDWKAFLLSGAIAVITFLIYPGFLSSLGGARHVLSLSVIAHFGVLGAIAFTVFILAMRWQRRYDFRTLGLLLSPVWTPYTLHYSYTTMIFTMRSAGLIRNLIFVAASIVLAVLFWQQHKVNEYLGAAGMILLAAVMAPAYSTFRSRIRPHTDLTDKHPIKAN